MLSKDLLLIRGFSDIRANVYEIVKTTNFYEQKAIAADICIILDELEDLVKLKEEGEK